MRTQADMSPRRHHRGADSLPGLRAVSVGVTERLSEPGGLFDWSAEVLGDDIRHGWSPERLRVLSRDATRGRGCALYEVMTALTWWGRIGRHSRPKSAPQEPTAREDLRCVGLSGWEPPSYS